MHGNFVSVRICRSTYGIKACVSFDPKIHSENSATISAKTKAKMAKDGFTIFRRKGDKVMASKEQVREFQPSDPTQKTASIELWESPSENPVYVTDEGCKCSFKYNINVPQSGDQTLVVEMYFGENEVRLKSYPKTQPGDAKELYAQFSEGI